MMVCWSYFYVRLCTYIHGVSVQLKTDELAEIPFLKKKNNEIICILSVVYEILLS